MIPIETFLELLDGVTALHGGHRWKAKCPAHDDATPSLSIREAEDGRILLHCFGMDCDINAICAAVGIRVADLMPPSLPRPYMRPEERGTNLTRTSAVDILDTVAHHAMCVLFIVADTMNRQGVEMYTEDERRQLWASAQALAEARALIIGNARTPKERKT